MTKQLKNGKHSKTSVLKLLGLEILLGSSDVLLSEFEVSKDTVVVNGSNEENNLSPAEGRNGLQGGNTVGDISGGELSGDEVVVGAGDLGDNVPNDGELGDASVLELGGAVLVEGLLVNVLGKAAGVPVSNGVKDSELVLVGVDGGGDASLLDGGEGGGGADEGSESKGGLHGCDVVKLDEREIVSNESRSKYFEEKDRFDRGVGGIEHKTSTMPEPLIIRAYVRQYFVTYAEVEVSFDDGF